MAERRYFEYSQTFNTQFTRKEALTQRVLYRLQVRQGEIPYFSRGIDVDEFSFRDPSDSILNVLRDITNSVSITNGRLTVADISVTIPESVIFPN